MENKIFTEYKNHFHSALLDDCIPFWEKSDLIDKEYGGFITSVDREGKSYNNDKSVWFQGRCLWTFSALCARYGIRESWLNAAKSGKEFLEKYCTDSDGRMFFTVTRDGRPLRKRRYMYSESFYVIGMAEYGALTGDTEALAKAAKCFDMMLDIYRHPENDPYRITPKSYAETRSQRDSAVPMVLISSGQILRRCIPERAEYYTDAVREVIGDILKYHYKPELKCVLETVASDGSMIDNPAGRTVNPGHSCENSWFIMCEALYSKDDELMKKALNLLDWHTELGWDKENGGMFYFVDVLGRPCEQLEWDMKLWWVHNEVLISTLLAYAVTKDKKYWNMFEKTYDYTFSHFADREYGEWYGYLHRDGSVSHTQKGSLWKGPFHLPRCLMLCEDILTVLESNGEIHSII